MWDLLSQPGLPPVRAIWAMDIASSGQSFLLNQDEIGDEPHWYDAARDITQMVNHFQAEMRPPLVGIGQSWGGAVLTVAAAFNPRLFQGLILIEPILENGWYHVHASLENKGEILVTGLGAAAPSLARRKRHYASRAALTESVQRAKMWDAYDPRVLQQILRYDYRDLEVGRVELITPPVQTVSYFWRPSPPLSGFPENEDYATRDEDANWPPGFYAAQGAVAKKALATLNCPLLFLWEKRGSFVSDEGYRQRVLASADALGRRKNQIEQIFVDSGHSLALFAPRKTAEAAATWIEKFWHHWLDEERRRQSDAPVDAQNVPPEFVERTQRVDAATADYVKRKLKL
ncbi:toxin biosynthesis protein [Cladophialophora carrionii]|uniref:Toxin biosynthesis protein n=1 Tax=Cladophialophora carrionii TaxID=86049 RepID=A0A1C1CLY3_9EURO|nr:toxin biosynthesis protein [Cladophialophora carrionii]